MTSWTVCPHAGEYRFDSDRLEQQWTRLHAGDAEPLPTSPALLEGWALYHSGAFEQAALAGLRAGAAGLTLANKATCIHATYVEPVEQQRLDLLLQAADRAHAQQAIEPHNPNAWYWQAYGLGRYSQGISVAKGLAKGLGKQIKLALETSIKLAPHHADAHLALANFHAEVIDKVGELIGGMTYGASRETALALYEAARGINPDSPITLTEYAHGLLMLGGDRGAQAAQLLERATAFEPADAMERLYVEAARMELEG